MKMTKKEFLNKLLAYVLSVVILSVSVGDAFIVTDDISTVEATGAVVVGGITIASLAEICLVVGAVAVTVYCAGEVIDNREAIARFGYDLINSASDTVDGWILSMTDTSGQEYVYGSEALDLIRDTGWEVIQGGLPPDDDDNNDDDKGNGQKPIKNPMQDLCNFTALGATWVMSHLEKLYQKWVNGEELTPAEQTALEPLISATCNQYDVAAQWSEENFSYSMQVDFITSNYTLKITQINDAVSTFPVAGYFRNDSSSISFLCKGGASFQFDCSIDVYYNDGRVVHENIVSSSGFGSRVAVTGVSVNANFPIFASEIAAFGYLEGTIPVTDALNYAKIYREADWLSDDWAGVLIDPLCSMGLSLSQLMEIARQLGLHAIGNNLTPQQLYELLKGLLAGENLGVLPEIPPSPRQCPALIPVRIRSTCRPRMHIRSPVLERNRILEQNQTLEPTRIPVQNRIPELIRIQIPAAALAWRYQTTR